MAIPNIKEEAHRLIEELPEDATWKDVEYVMHVRQQIEQGLQDAEAGRTMTTDELRQRLGLDGE
jgi:predicted transcriptional regulator